MIRVNQPSMSEGRFLVIQKNSGGYFKWKIIFFLPLKI